MQGGSGFQLSYVAMASNKLHAKPSIDDLFTTYVTHDEEMGKGELIIAAGNPLGTE